MSDLERMAREASLWLPEPALRPRWPGDLAGWSAEQVRVFADLIRADEQERCAKVAENTQTALLPSGWFIGERVAAAIRAGR